jgi:hypothetical protein
MELPIDLFIMKEDGSLQLSDDTKKLLKRYHASVLVGGVYAPGKKNSYVSLRMVDTISKAIISSTDVSIPMGPDAKLLMTPKEVGSAGARGETVAEAASPEAAATDTAKPAAEKTTTDSLE